MSTWRLALYAGLAGALVAGGLETLGLPWWASVAVAGGFVLLLGATVPDVEHRPRHSVHTGRYVIERRDGGVWLFAGGEVFDSLDEAREILQNMLDEVDEVDDGGQPPELTIYELVPVTP